MRALVLAAGLGTRLRPLTNDMPKPLVPVCGRPMIAYVLDVLTGAGIREAKVNTHYLPEQMRVFISRWNQSTASPVLSEQDEVSTLLGSGGAVSRAGSWLFEKDDLALVCNADVIASPQIAEFIERHRQLQRDYGVRCTLSLVRHPEAGVKYTGVRESNGLITKFERRSDSSLYHFPGFYLIDSYCLSFLPKSDAAFSIMDVLWQPLLERKQLGAWIYSGDYLDVGNVADLRMAEEKLAQRPNSSSTPCTPSSGPT